MRLHHLFESVTRSDKSISWKQKWHENGLKYTPMFKFDENTDTGFIGVFFIPMHDIHMSELSHKLTAFCTSHEMKMDYIRDIIFNPALYKNNYKDAQDEEELLEQTAEDAANSIMKIGSELANENILPRGYFYGSCPSTVGGLEKIIDALREKYDSTKAHHVGTSSEGVSIHATGYDGVDINMKVMKELFEQTFPDVPDIASEMRRMINRFNLETGVKFSRTVGAKFIITTKTGELFMVVAGDEPTYAAVREEDGQLELEELNTFQMTKSIPNFIKLMQEHIYKGPVSAADKFGTHRVKLDKGMQINVPMEFITDVQLKQAAESVLTYLSQFQTRIGKEIMKGDYDGGAAAMEMFAEDYPDFNPLKITDADLEEYMQREQELKEFFDTMKPPFEHVEELRENGGSDFAASVVSVIAAENESSAYFCGYDYYKDYCCTN